MVQHLTAEQKYIKTTSQVLPAIVPENPNYKEQVGTAIYGFVNFVVSGHGRKQQNGQVQKIAGEIIDLPIEDIKSILQDYDLFKTRVSETIDLQTDKHFEPPKD